MDLRPTQGIAIPCEIQSGNPGHWGDDRLCRAALHQHYGPGHSVCE